MNLLESPSCATIKRWEQAGVSLVTALKDYMELCLDLGTNSLREGAEPKDLVSRIDSTLAAVHVAISHNLNESTSALARTRNKLASPLFCFPEEVLSEIFVNVVYDRHNAKHLTVEQEVRLIYRHLYSLLGVCSAWKDIIMKRGSFWSVIPVFSTPSAAKRRPFELSLKRAGGSALHLAADTDLINTPVDFDVLLAEHGSRFRTVNISTADAGEIENAIKGLLQHNTPGLLSELSIQHTEMRDEAEIPSYSDYIITRDSPRQASFASLVRNLVAFRISRAQFHWDTLTFSSRLVEFRIQEVTLGYDNAIIPLVYTLSSASNLRDLKFISVSTFCNFATRNATLPSPVTFPALQSLFIEDLYLNTLEHLLSTIAPGSYDLTLFLSPNSLYINVLEDVLAEDITEDFNHVNGLCRVVKNTSIDTLMISGLLEGGWLATSGLVELLKAMPALKTLKMQAWIFDQDLCKGLTRPKKAQISSRDHPLPTLQNLHFSLADIRDKKGFEALVTSHPLRQIILGGQLRIDQSIGWEPLQEDSTIVQWLRRNTQHLDFQLVEKEYCLPEFHLKKWKLW